MFRPQFCALLLLAALSGTGNSSPPSADPCHQEHEQMAKNCISLAMFSRRQLTDWEFIKSEGHVFKKTLNRAQLHTMVNMRFAEGARISYEITEAHVKNASTICNDPLSFRSSGSHVNEENVKEIDVDLFHAWPQSSISIEMEATLTLCEPGCTKFSARPTITLINAEYTKSSQWTFAADRCFPLTQKNSKPSKITVDKKDIKLNVGDGANLSPIWSEVFKTIMTRKDFIALTYVINELISDLDSSFRTENVIIPNLFSCITPTADSSHA